MEGDKGKQPAPPPAAASVSAVFSNDDLLREILVRVGFPTFLVRAALVSERWLRHAADPAFLRRFRALHPPHLLGFYVALAAAINRCKFDDSFGEHLGLGVIDCRHGRRLLFERSNNTSRCAVWGPLRPVPAMVSLPPPPSTLLDHPILPVPVPCYSQSAFLLPKDGDDGMIIAVLTFIGVQASARVYVPRSGDWVVHETAETEPPMAAAPYGFVVTTISGNLYVVSLSGYIIGFDLAATNLYVVKLPDEVRMDGLRTNVKLICGEDARLFLVYGEGPQLSVWHHRNHADPTCDWVLVDTITVREASNRCENALVLAVGDDAEFVFVGLEASGIVICVDMRSRTENVLDVPMECDMRSISIMPYMMVWPPVFPALNENHGQE
ncbi:hypothetical protein ACP70R_034270 [Stipagrostis hirtigluma subsp. patula]